MVGESCGEGKRLNQSLPRRRDYVIRAMRTAGLLIFYFHSPRLSTMVINDKELQLGMIAYSALA